MRKQEGASPGEESKASGGKRFRHWGSLAGSEGCAPGEARRGVRGIHGRELFCSVLGLLTFVSENEVSVWLEGQTHVWPLRDTLGSWLFRL